MNKFKVAFLIDKNNDWIYKYFRKSIFSKTFKKKYVLKIFFNKDNILNYDVVFLLNYTKILKNNFLSKNKLNLVIHNSDLPKGKGFSPMQWQILKNKKKMKISLFEAKEKFDSGNIFFKEDVVFTGAELYDELREKQFTAILKLVKKFLKLYPKVRSTKQLGKSTFYKKRTKEDSKLNINLSLKKQFNLLRICNNDLWPAFFYFKNKKYIVKIFKG